MSVTLCLGEALVDMIGEAPAPSPSAVPHFRPHFGGATANVAVFAARAGARVALAGAAGDDRWGGWLRERLAAERVDATYYPLVPGVSTQLAFVSVDERGEPTYLLYGELVEPIVDALEDRLEQAVEAAVAVFISSNTLAGEHERALTMRARELALQRERPVVLDCNLRLHRWPSRTDAAASANACVPGTLLVRANHAEAEILTGERDPERAALALREAGAELVVITMGAEGAILRGAGLRVDVPAVAPARVRSTIGAGDALTGILLARLALSDFSAEAAAAALEEAVASAAAVCERWGSLD